MLKKRVIPTLLWDGIQCVKPVSFERPYRKLGAMEQYIQVMERRNIDELILIDIEATPQGREPNYDKIRAFCDNLYCPVTYGGGISSLDHISKLLACGADKVAINSHIEILKPAVEKFGAQAIVGVCDFYPNADGDRYCEYLVSQGVGEILLTSMLNDGVMNGYDLNMISEVSNLPVPLIANGGCGDPEHMEQAFRAGASAVAAGSLFLYTEQTPRSCAKYLNDRGYSVRIQ